ncbi:MAG: hypothetical protein IIB19_05170 [Chloroflexi bacterium]|nr:hypothetical protein [Chloroflexota bacterium]
MSSLEYVLRGNPERYKSGRGKRCKNYSQKFRILSEPIRQIRNVTLKTKDKAVARARVKEYVEQKVREIVLKQDPELRTKCNGIMVGLQEWIDNKLACGDTEKDTYSVQTKIKLIIKEAGFTEFAEVDAVKAIKAIADLQRKRKFRTVTANRYLEALKAWTHWLYVHERWERDPLAIVRKFKGDLSNLYMARCGVDDKEPVINPARDISRCQRRDCLHAERPALH